MRETLKRLLPTWLIRRGRSLDRFRWIAKWRLLRFWKFDIGANPLRAAEYILLDPELESYSYEIANEEALANFVASLLNVSPMEVAGWIAETKADEVLARDRGLSLTHKRRLPLGYRLAWYAIIRGLKPKVVIEAGIHRGLGSEVVLRALQRNAGEGSAGRLISFDLFEDTGQLVSPKVTGEWERVIESTRTGLERVLRGVEVGLFIHDIQHVEEPHDFEFELVRAHAAERLVIIDSIGKHPALPEFCQRRGGQCFYFREEPKDHFLQPSGSRVGLFERAKTKPQREETSGDG